MSKNKESYATRIARVANVLEREKIPAGTQYAGMEEAAEQAVRHMMTAMFPSHFGAAEDPLSGAAKRADQLEKAHAALTRALEFVCTEEESRNRAMELIELLPEIFEELKSDIFAAYQGDPAAPNMDEIILTYPAFKAIGSYRIAHRLYQMKVPILPRMLTEYAHRLTGIDIHPGATIGRHFFIDHGTGVVVGETTTIGEHVKLYQNVTLGAKSFEVGEDGSLVKGTKRHPDLGSNVVVYAGATILGGNTRIGDRCTVGGNVWLTHSLEADKTIAVQAEVNDKSMEVSFRECCPKD